MTPHPPGHPMIVYGFNPVLEALRAGRVREIRVAARADERVQALIAEAAVLGVSVRRVTRDELDAQSRRGVHQGVVAEVSPPERVDHGRARHHRW